MVTMVVMVVVMEVMGRWKQTAELGPVPNTELENVFMAVAVDDDIDLHPKNKRLPAERLGWAAANLVYGLGERPLGAPTPVEVEVWTHEHNAQSLTCLSSRPRLTVLTCSSDSARMWSCWRQRRTGAV